MSDPSSSGLRPALHRRRRLLASILIPVGLAVAVAGSVFGLYDRIAFFDEAVHGFNFFIAALVFALFFYGRVLSGIRGHRALLVATIAVLGLGIGAVWEIIEWAYDQIRAPNLILGKTDTIYDLIIDTAGAAVAGLLVVVPSPRRREDPSSD